MDEILNINFPFPKNIITLFFESFKNHVPYDIIGVIWDFYKSVDAKYIIGYGNYNVDNYGCNFNIIFDSNYTWQTGPINILGFYDRIPYNYAELSFINHNNQNIQNYFTYINTYLKPINFKNLIDQKYTNHIYKYKTYKYGNNQYYLFNMNKNDNEIIKSIVNTNKYVNVIFKLLYIQSNITSHGQNPTVITYLPLFEILYVNIL